MSNVKAHLRPAGLIAGLLLLLLVLAVRADAVEAVESFTMHQQAGVTDTNFTFTLSPDDPDQTAGSLVYTLVVDGTENAVAQTAVSGRSTWVEFVDTPDFGLHEYKIRVTDGFTTADSCVIAFNQQGVSSGRVQKGCGANSTVEEVTGVSAIVTVAGSASVHANVSVEYAPSADDPGISFGGEFAYNVVLCSSGNTYALCDDATKIPHTAPATDVMGNNTRITILDVFPVDSGQKAYIAIEAFDHKTHRRAVFSCQVVVDLSQLYSKDACGTAPLPSEFLSDDGPQMPFVRLPELAVPLGLSVTSVAFIFGGVMVGALVVLGARIAGAVGALIGAGLGVGAGAVFNLVPLWAVVITFMAAAGYIIWQIVGGTRGSSD